MKINIISDLHLDMGPELPVIPGGDVLVISGDTCEARQLRRYAEDRHGLLDGTGIKLSNKDRINTFIRELGERYREVIIVAGNHEHYHGTFSTTIQKMRDNLPDNFHVLDNNVFELDDVLFLGATMWTNCNNYDPMTQHVLKYGMGDFDCVRKIYNGDYIRLTPYDTIEEHEKTLAYFKCILRNPINIDKKIVVVTHHAPTHLSIAEKWRHDALMNGGFYTDLSEFILDHPEIKLWVHGHTHTPFDYMVGDHTRVICNPRGYVTRNNVEVTNWNPNLVIEI